MQDRYTGDVGDFGKYGLLRALCSDSGLRLGVVWYLTPSEQHNDDGKHVSYLLNNGREYRVCDPELYDCLRGLLIDPTGNLLRANRRVALIESSGVLPSETRFYNQILSSSLSLGRYEGRRAWFQRAMEATQDADVVFLDPDNGIECKSARPFSRNGAKYVFWEEIQQFLNRGQSLVIYHHLNRSCGSDKQVRNLVEAAAQRTPKGYVVDATLYCRGTRRAYLLLAANRHMFLLERLKRLRETPWHLHFLAPRVTTYNETMSEERAAVTRSAVDVMDEMVARGEITLTPLGKALLEARRRIEASGIPLLTDQELERERAERRGGVENRGY